MTKEQNHKKSQEQERKQEKEIVAADSVQQANSTEKVSNFSTEDKAKAFKRIKEFVDNLHTVFGPKQKSLQLFHRLLQKTTIEQIEAYNRYINAFVEFCSKNQACILAKNTNLVVSQIVYTNVAKTSKLDIKIDMKQIFDAADVQDKNSIWKHLQGINVCFDSSADAIQAFQKSLNEDTPESQMINNIMNQVQSSIDPNSSADPMMSIMSLVTSGKLQDIMGTMTQSMSSGNIDIKKIFNSLHSVMNSVETNLSEEKSATPSTVTTETKTITQTINELD